ncbi:MAG: ABC transporter permease [Trueperaceae bacterium]|nr:ABC transporter permease [Trueperaceae bacterium]MCC6309627.1 ABC transporter permease [Trueperaceae bacterium]MCO5173338.1 ABC transporter permease [Trueperaceae bacterium]MCW5818370.1 ABC transporter permease [Trueperaceae bacterium]
MTIQPQSSPDPKAVARKVRRDLAVRRTGRFGMWLSPFVVYLFLWVPIVVLVVFSFNDGNSVSVWRGFTTRWYENIFHGTISAGTEAARFQTELLLKALRNSLLVATVATLISSALGTMLSLALARGRFWGRKTLDTLFYLPVVIPDITQGIALAVFFNIVFETVQRLFGVRLVSGFGTIVIAHVAFNVSYVAIVVRARLAGMDPRLEEAGRDLGANHWQTFWRITFPNLLPGVMAGALLAFTLSLDDFVITFFNSGVGTTTLPLFVYGMLKQRVPPEINAISTLMILASIILVGGSLLLQQRGNRDKG